MLWLSLVLVPEGLLATDRLCGTHSCCVFLRKDFRAEELEHDIWAIIVAIESFVNETEVLSLQGWSIYCCHLVLPAVPRLALFSC